MSSQFNKNSSYQVLLQNQFDAAQKLIAAQRTTISELRDQQEQLLTELQELRKEVEAWRAHAKAYEAWFTTVPRVGIPQLKNRHQRYTAAVAARDPYYRAAVTNQLVEVQQDQPDQPDVQQGGIDEPSLRDSI